MALGRKCSFILICCLYTFLSIISSSFCQVDIEAPRTYCYNDVFKVVPAGSNGTSDVFWKEPTAADNSGMVYIQNRSNAQGDFFPVGQTVVTYLFVDPSGNTASCSFTVTIIPVICNKDVSKIVPAGSNGTSVTWLEPTIADNSGSVLLQHRTSAPGDFFPVGQTVVTYVFTDPSGKNVSCNFNVNIIPVICINDVSKIVPAGSNGTSVTWLEPTATDNSGSVLLLQRTNAPGDFFPVGKTAVRYILADTSGKRIYCYFNVNIIPVICINDVSKIVPAGSNGTSVTWLEPTAADNSGSVLLQRRSNAPGDFFPVGKTVVTYVFTDPSGKSVSCNFNVNIIPVICSDDVSKIVPDGSNGTSATWLEPTAADNSGSVLHQLRSNAPGDFFPVGQTVVTYVYTDPSGKSVSCNFNVTITPASQVDDNPEGHKVPVYLAASFFLLIIFLLIFVAIIYYRRKQRKQARNTISQQVSSS